MASLWESRKFRIMVYDTAVALVMFVVSRFFGPEIQQAVTELIAILQPVVFALVVGIAVEDAAAKRAGGG
jgi:cytochrome P450